MARLPDLDLDQMVGQMLYLDLLGEAELDLLRRYRVGGVMVRRRYVKSIRQLVRLVSRHQEEAVLPLLVGANFEWGVGNDTPSGTLFPGLMTIGASGKRASAQEYARVTSKEAALIGVNHVMTPVLDINRDSGDLQPTARSFSDDPGVVAEMAEIVVTTFQKNRIMATAKHFPGVVDRNADPHERLPVIEHDLKGLSALELIPFKRAIKAGVKCIMVSHAYLPALMGDEPRPASLSPDIVQNLLRGKLGFDGLIITDNLTMGAVSKRMGPLRACLKAIRAGCDLLLTRQDHLKPTQFQDLVRAVERDKDLVRRVEESSRRILEAKEWLGAFKGVNLSAEEAVEGVGSEANRKAAHRVALAGIVVYRNGSGLLPIKPKKKETVLVVTPKLPESFFVSIKDNWGRLYRRVRELHEDTRPAYVSYSPTKTETHKTIRAAERADHVIAVMAHEIGHKVDGKQARLVNTLLETRPDTVIAVLGNPYPVSLLSDNAAAVLLTFSNMPESQSACAEVILGKSKPNGKLPVKI